MSADYEAKIQRGLILYLREEHEIEAVEAELGMTEMETAYFTGCDTCGYGGGEDRAFTPLRYKAEGEPWWQSIELDTQYSIDLLPKLLPYIDKANR